MKFEHANEAYGDEHLAEQDDDEGDAEEPLDGAEPGLDLEAALQHELAEAAHEADALEAAGEEPEVVEALDESAQRVAEALISLRTARAKASAVKKDRKGGFPAAAGRSASPAVTRSSGGLGAVGRHPAAQKVQRDKEKSDCWDCLERGHWAGDPACKMPGAGLGRPKSRNASQAEAAYEDALRAELGASVAEQMAEAAEPTEFDARVTESDAFNPTARTSLTLNDLVPISETETILDVPALPNESTPRKPRAHEALAAGADIVDVDESHLTSSSKDHKPEGALDSACNRSVGGFPWVETYLSLLSALGPFSWVCRVETNEVFRFGDGGRLRASWRYRLPNVLLWSSHTLLDFRRRFRRIEAPFKKGLAEKRRWKNLFSPIFV